MNSTPIIHRRRLLWALNHDSLFFVLVLSSKDGAHSRNRVYRNDSRKSLGALTLLYREHRPITMWLDPFRRAGTHSRSFLLKCSTIFPPFLGKDDNIIGRKEPDGWGLNPRLSIVELL